jgi:hypothetical protein
MTLSTFGVGPHTTEELLDLEVWASTSHGVFTNPPYAFHAIATCPWRTRDMQIEPASIQDAITYLDGVPCNHCFPNADDPYRWVPFRWSELLIAAFRRLNADLPD